MTVRELITKLAQADDLDTPVIVHLGTRKRPDNTIVFIREGQVHYVGRFNEKRVVLCVDDHDLISTQRY